jgi:MFS-type transporter involved in bile tolerance (Atg22 family)
VTATEAGRRPTALLPIGQLARLSAYWLGLTAIDAAVGQFTANRLTFHDFVAAADVGKALAVVGLGGAVIGIVIQPTIGTMSDYATTRWGRRKPFIVFGSLLDVVFLFGVATSNTLVALAVFVALLSFSTNVARGPFQGYVPDLIAAPQVGMASALVGLMQILGNVTGFLLLILGISLGAAPLALMAVALVELVTMISVVYRVAPGPPPVPRQGRSWGSIAREAWGTDILRERSYVWLLASRLFFLTGGSILVNLAQPYLAQVFGLGEKPTASMVLVFLVVIALGNLVAAIPASRLSDRVGRKPIIYVACVVGGAGVAIAGLAPAIPIAVIGIGLFGVSAGMFLAVDWALMTDIIPMAAAGRYMGLSNVATGASSPIGVALGGLILDAVNKSLGLGTGPRAAFLVGAVLYLIAAVLLRPVDPRPRGE